MSMAFGSKLQLESGSWAQHAYDVCIGIAVGAMHSIYITGRWWYDHFIVPLLMCVGLGSHHHPDAEESSKEKKELKVVAVGYGRTGTYSLKLALDELGFPCLHTQHLYEHPSIMKMWDDRVFLPSIQQEKTLMGRPDLTTITNAGFTATADLPMALYFEQVLEEFPDCKFILTTRENSEVWFRSWDTLTKSITEPTNYGSLIYTSVKSLSYYLRWLYSVVNKDESFLTCAFPLPAQNKQAAIASYEEHNSRVRQLVPADQLLEYSVKQGWEPLCNFLDLPAAECPDTPFPKTNSALSVQVQAISGFVTPLICILLVYFYGFARLFRRWTGMTVIQWINWKRHELSLILRQFLQGNGEQQGIKKKKTHHSKRAPSRKHS